MKVIQVNKAPTQPKKVEKNNLTILKGYTTSQINQALKSDSPYPARVFLKVDNQEQDIPIFFRIKEDNQWLRPKIKTSSLIEIKGQWAINKEMFPNCKMRKSFTAYSYQILACPHSQKKPYYCPTDCPCLKGKEVLNQQVQQLTHDK